MLKRILATVLVSMMLLSFTACSASGGDSEFLVYEGIILDTNAPAGGGSIYLKLKLGWTVYTVEDTRCFDAADMTYTLPRIQDLKPGTRVKVWADKDTEQGESAVYCILMNPASKNSGGCYRVGDVEENGGMLTFTDTMGEVSVTAAKDKVYETSGRLAPGALCFVWFDTVEEGNPTQIQAKTVSVITSPEKSAAVSAGQDGEFRQDVMDSLLLDEAQPAAATPAPQSEPLATPDPVLSARGNTTGNIVNDGEVAFDGESLIVFETTNARFANVYKGYVYYVNMNAGGKIYRQALTGEQAECISDATDAAYLNVVDDAIFYRSTDDGYSIHSMNLDGSDDKKLSSMRASRLAAVDGCLYYANWDDDTQGLWRMDYRGGSPTLLFGGDVPLFINVYSGKVYWVSYQRDSCLAVTDPYTGETVFAEDVKNISALNVYQDQMYFYMEAGGSSGIYRMNTDLTGFTFVYGGSGLYNINIANDTVYFRTGGDTKAEDDDILYCCELDGSNVQRVQ